MIYQPRLFTDKMLGNEQKYIYGWKNNSKRQTLYGRICRVIARMKMNSAWVEFENGQQECISRNALRKVNEIRKANSHDGFMDE
jgi:hypothetical protein